MTIKDWLQSMADAGFTGTFTAESGEKKIIGELVKDDLKVIVKVIKKGK